MLLSGLSGGCAEAVRTRRKRRRRPDFGPRPISCYPSRRTTAGCPSGQWKRTVNPSRELRRFESFTCHPVPREALTSGNAGQGLLYVRRTSVALTRLDAGALVVP